MTRHGMSPDGDTAAAEFQTLLAPARAALKRQTRAQAARPGSTAVDLTAVVATHRAALRQVKARLSRLRSATLPGARAS